MARRSGPDRSGRARGGPPNGGAERPARKQPAKDAGTTATPPVSGIERFVTKIETTLNDHAAHHDRIAEKVAAKAERQQDAARKLTERAEQLGRRAEQLERTAERISALDVWTRKKPDARRPRFTLDQLASTAVRIADEEGFGALSMRHLASELGAGTMTLYHYVRTKDELLALVMDTVMGEVVLGPDDVMPESWRDALTLIARRTRACLLRHPWWIDITDEPQLGPNLLLHLDQTVQAVASLDLPLAEKLEITSVVDEYVFGYCLQERQGPGDLVEPPAPLIAYVDELLDTGDYPQLTALAADLGRERLWLEITESMRDEDRFDRNLKRLLDGIEANLP
jgi:AcrR family transcriptional regulator